jgi:fibronectin type 3 domain-containing protein
MKVFKLWSSVIIGLILSSIVLAGCEGNSAPAAPTGVTANPGNGQVTIAWPQVTNAASYNIYYSTSSGVTGGTITNGTLIGSATSPYTQTGLTNGTTYYYVVTAEDGSGDESGSSAQVSATPTLPVTATPADSQVTIAWPQVTGATSYNIYWSTTSQISTGTNTNANVTNVTTTSGSVPSLSDGVTYYFVVTSVINGVESAGSTPVSAMPSSAPAPAEPTGVTVTPGNGQITIAWPQVTNATSYNIYWSTNPGVTSGAGTNGTLISGVTTTSYTQIGLTNGTIYYYVVTAVDGNGESPASIQVSVAPST